MKGKRLLAQVGACLLLFTALQCLCTVPVVSSGGMGYRDNYNNDWNYGQRKGKGKEQWSGTT